MIHRLNIGLQPVQSELFKCIGNRGMQRTCHQSASLEFRHPIVAKVRTLKYSAYYFIDVDNANNFL